jgi:hypothetical protein
MGEWGKDGVVTQCASVCTPALDAAERRLWLTMAVTPRSPVPSMAA